MMHIPVSLLTCNHGQGHIPPHCLAANRDCTTVPPCIAWPHCRETKGEASAALVLGDDPIF